MAYLDLTDEVPAPAMAPQSVAPRPAERLTGIERDVLHLSRSDSLATVRTHGPWRCRIATLLGVRRCNPLADPHLEALRRFAVLFRQAAHIDETAEIDRLSAAGYSMKAIAQARNMLVRTPYRPIRRISQWLVVPTAFSAPIGWFFMTTAKALDNYLLAGILTIVLGLPFATLTRSR